MSWWTDFVENAGYARDVKMGTVGALLIRDLYAQGEDEAALLLAKEHIIASGVGIAAGIGGLPLLKQLPKAMPYLNAMMPGTSEFMSIYNAGKAGKAAALGLAGLEAANEAGALDRFVLDPSVQTGAEAAIGASPVIGAGFGLAARGVSNGLDIMSRASKGFRDFLTGVMSTGLQLSDAVKRFGKRIKKWYTAPERVHALYEKAVANDAAAHSQYIADRTRMDRIPQLTYPGITQEIKESASRLRLKESSLQQAYWGDRDFYRFEGSATRRSSNRNREYYMPKSADIDFSKLSTDDFINFLSVRLFGRDNVANQATLRALILDALDITKTNDGFVIKSKIPSSGDIYEPARSVSTYYKVHNLEDLDALPLEGNISFPSSSSLSREFLRTGDLGVSIEEIPVISSGIDHAQMDPAYPLLLEKNIEYLQKFFPGFKPFGSSVGVAQAHFPHGTHDIDGYMTESAWNSWFNLNKGKYRIELTADDTFKVWLADPAKYGDDVGIDVNILRSKDGHITGSRALEMARLYYPEEYSKAVLLAVESGKTPEEFIKLTPELLLDVYNPIEKTIADLFEINPSKGLKGKLTGRLFVYMSEADPDMVAQGLRRFGSSHGVREYFPATIEELGDVELNKLILESLGIPGNIGVIASDPKKMKNALDYWYLNQTLHMRGVSADANYDKAMRHWLGSANTGGSAYGAGLNTVTYGDSGFGPVKGFFLVLSSHDFSQAPLLERIKGILLFTGSPEYLFTPTEIGIILLLARQAGLTEELVLKLLNITNSNELLDVLPRDDNAAKLLQSLNDVLGIRSLTRGNLYESGRYSSMTSDVDVPIYFQLFGQGDSSPMGLYARMLRMRAASMNGNITNGLFSSVTTNGRILPEFWQLRTVQPSRISELETPVLPIFSRRAFYMLNRYPGMSPYDRLALRAAGKYSDFLSWKKLICDEYKDLNKKVKYYENERRPALNHTVNGVGLLDLEHSIRNARNTAKRNARAVGIVPSVILPVAGAYIGANLYNQEIRRRQVADYKEASVDQVPMYLYEDYIDSPDISDNKKLELKVYALQNYSITLGNGGVMNYFNYFSR